MGRSHGIRETRQVPGSPGALPRKVDLTVYQAAGHLCVMAVTPRAATASLVLAMVLASGCAGSPPDGRSARPEASLLLDLTLGGNATLLRIESEEPLVLIAANMTGVFIESDPRPAQLTFIGDDGRIQPLMAGGEWDSNQLAAGDGVLTVGAAGTTVESPAVLTDPRGAWMMQAAGEDLSANAGWLVAVSLQPDVRLLAEFATGARLVQRLDGSASILEFADFQDGARIYTPVVGASAQDHARLDGPHVFLHAFLGRSNRASGQIVLSGPSSTHEVPLGRPPTEGAVVNGLDWHRFAWSTAGPVDVSVDWAGVARGERLYMTVVQWTGPSMPDGWLMTEPVD